MSASWSKYVVVILSFISLTGLVPNSQAQTFEGHNFTLNGDAQLVEDKLRLTEALNSQVGSAFVTAPFVFNDGSTDFSVFFRFRMYDGSVPGADGLTFTLHSDAAGATALGGPGFGLGYEGILSSVSNEFDVWFNDGLNEPLADHWGLNVNGSVDSLYDADAPGGLDLDNGQHRFVWIDHLDSADEIHVFLSGLPLKPASPSYEIDGFDLGTYIGASVYAGFTASTGGANNVHDIEEFKLSWGALENFHSDLVTQPVPSSATWSMLILAGMILLLGSLWIRRFVRLD